MAGTRKRTMKPSSSFQFTNLTKSLTFVFFLASSLDRIFLDHGPLLSCQALSSSSTKFKSAIPTTKLESVGRSQFAVLDGAEWKSVQSILRDQRQGIPESSPTTKYGYMSVLTGKDENNRRIVAMQCTDSDEQAFVYEDSIAVIPKQVSDEDAISTYIASLSSVVCALPRVKNIGGSGEEVSATISGKAVVLGSGDLACFSAEGLASLGIEVFLVNNKGSASVRKNVGKLQVMQPAIGEDEIGFAYHLGEFDSLVDTIGNERTSFGDGMMSLGDSTLQLLISQHKCYNYISTLTESQDIVTSEGILWGPGKADGYSEKVGNRSFLMKSRDSQSIIPPKAIGSTLETLLKNGVILSEKQRSKACSKKSDAIRGWSLSDFWEQTSWPRDSSGSGTTRYGLPVRETFDEVEMINGLAVSAPPTVAKGVPAFRKSSDEYDEYGAEYEDDVVDDDASSSSPVKKRPVQNNPYVMDILDIADFENEIVQTKKNCIMFMSARFCKTCKTINPSYTRMARIGKEKGRSKNFTFVKAETGSPSGKKLAKLVSVRAVPSFVFVREGKILGQIYASKLPNEKVKKGMELLESGAEWDDSLVDDDDDEDE